MTIKTPPLALGTANFGLNYGITSGRKVPEDEVSEILDTCREFGVNMIDTAVAYGDCHKILGNVGCSDFHIVTKVPKIPTETKNVRDWLYRTIDNALIDLNRSDLYGLLFHHPMDLQSPLGSTLAEAAVSIKARFNIQRVGLSLYDPDELDKFYGVIPTDLIQVPANVLDDRFLKEQVLSKTSNRGIEVHTRSLFLQGLLLSHAKERSAYFDRWRDVLERFDSFCKRQGQTALKTSLGLIHQHRAISRWVVGVDSAPQLTELLDTFLSLSASPYAIPKDLQGLPLELINPSLWKTT